MLLSVTVFTLFMMGFWLYCLTDAILAAAREFPRMPKPAWIVVHHRDVRRRGYRLARRQAACAQLIRPVFAAMPPLGFLGIRPDRPMGDDYFQTARWTDPQTTR